MVERTRRDGSLTSAGDFIANYVLRAESLLAQADLGAAQFRKSGSGSLSIVASWLTGTYLLPELIAEFRHLHPAVQGAVVREKSAIMEPIKALLDQTIAAIALRYAVDKGSRLLARSCRAKEVFDACSHAAVYPRDRYHQGPDGRRRLEQP